MILTEYEKLWKENPEIFTQNEVVLSPLSKLMADTVDMNDD